MGSIGNPKTWVPYESNKDCSQGFCSLYCPQWCYIALPPPPPYKFPDEVSSTNFTTLFIVLIGVLASTFLIGSYYTIISKYCWNLDWRRRRSDDPIEELNQNQNHSNNEPWQASATGLDDGSIKSIKAFKYNKEDGLIEGTDCSVCLGEFQEDESLRLLPKCSHAFHLSCIDAWLKSHSNCPLCRANVVCSSNLPLQSPRAVQENLPNITSSSPENQIEDHTIVPLGDIERSTSDEVVPSNDIIPKSPSELLQPMEGLEQSGFIIEIRDKGAQPIRRSVSMDLSCSNRVSITDILSMSEEEDPQTEGQEHQVVLGSSSKQRAREHSKFSNNRSRVLHCVMSRAAMKRSFSSGRLLFSRHGRGCDSHIDVNVID